VSAADWPSHDNPEWQRVLDKARGLGWPAPAWSKSHPSINLKCPTGACAFLIFKTGGKNTDRVAIQTYRKLDRCTHGDLTSSVAKVDVALNTADRLVSGAEVLISRGEAQARVEAALADIDEAVGEAAEALEAEFDQAGAALTDLDDRASELLGSDHQQREPATVAAEADPHLRAAKIDLAVLPKRADVVIDRQTRLAELRVRRDAISSHRA
jgi:hypothetical protein